MAIYISVFFVKEIWQCQPQINPGGATSKLVIRFFDQICTPSNRVEEIEVMFIF
jgi:hypothetical protein